MKNRPIRAKIGLTKLGLWTVILVVVLGIGFGGKILLDKSNDSKRRQISEEVVSKLISEGTYASIRSYTTDNFLGDMNEQDYNDAAKELVTLKGSQVKSLNSSSDTVFGTITPKDPAKDGDYLFGYNVTFKKTGLMSYKVVNIVTDYGRQSFFDANRE